MKPFVAERFEWLLSLLLWMVLVGSVLIACLMGGCATGRPCLDGPAPQKTVMYDIEPPTAILYIDAAGVSRVARRYVVVPESADHFFSYVNSLEGVSRRAATCHR